MCCWLQTTQPTSGHSGFGKLLCKLCLFLYDLRANKIPLNESRDLGDLNMGFLNFTFFVTHINYLEKKVIYKYNVREMNDSIDS